MERFDIDQAKAEIALEEAAQRCGVTITPHGAAPNVRIDCPFDCPGDHAGKHEISINVEHPDKVFRCHSYQCQFRGNLLHLMHGWLMGEKPPGGRIRGKDFERVKGVLMSASSHATPAAQRAAPPRPVAKSQEPPRCNIPLAAAENPKARELVGMEEILTTDIAAMTPAASNYWRRRRHFLTPDICESWGVGVRPGRDGGDKRGWTLKGHVVYRFLSEDNQVLCYVGRDPEFEEKITAYETRPQSKRDDKKLPAKYKFPAGFHRGLELYGQHGSRLAERPEYRAFLASYGVIVVEGFNDVLALDALGVPAVGICGNRMTAEQVAKVARWARRLGGGKVAILFDCEPSGDDGAKDALWQFSQLASGLRVRLAWSEEMHGGHFRGRQPESLTAEERDRFLLPALRDGA